MHHPNIIHVTPALEIHDGVVPTKSRRIAAAFVGEAHSAKGTDLVPYHVVVGEDVKQALTHFFYVNPRLNLLYLDLVVARLSFVELPSVFHTMESYRTPYGDLAFPVWGGNAEAMLRMARQYGV